jgi:hypothetical protein
LEDRLDRLKVDMGTEPESSVREVRRDVRCRSSLIILEYFLLDSSPMWGIHIIHRSRPADMMRLKVHCCCFQRWLIEASKRH